MRQTRHHCLLAGPSRHKHLQRRQREQQYRPPRSTVSLHFFQQDHRKQLDHSRKRDIHRRGPRQHHKRPDHRNLLQILRTAPRLNSRWKGCYLLNDDKSNVVMKVYDVYDNNDVWIFDSVMEIFPAQEEYNTDGWGRRWNRLQATRREYNDCSSRIESGSFFERNIVQRRERVEGDFFRRLSTQFKGTAAALRDVFQRQLLEAGKIG
jgi:hypothetical protein